MNRVELTGNLVRDPVLKDGETPKCLFTVAVSRPWTSAGGERQADFIDCVAWRKTAQFVARNFRKGKRIEIGGRLRSRTWTDESGRRCYATEVSVDEAEFAGGPGNGQDDSREAPPGNPDTGAGTLPF